MKELKNGERLKMRNWLEQVINDEEFAGVEWTDRRHGKFRVPWKHASRHGWDIEKDASIFKRWAVYTGKFPDNNRQLSEGDTRKLAKVWKANFRCALNALQDVEVLREEGKSKGTDAYKVFQLLPKKVKTGKVRLNSQGCEESRIGIKIRKRSDVTKRCDELRERHQRTYNASRTNDQETVYYPSIDHNYSDKHPSFNMKNEMEDISCLIEELDPTDAGFSMPNNTMYCGGETGVSHYGNVAKYCSSEEFDTSSSGSESECNPEIVAQILKSFTQTTSYTEQQAIKSEFADVYQVTNLSGLPFVNTHFKDGANDPFCGGFDNKELSLAWQFRV